MSLTRMERFERAKKLKLDPPARVKQVDCMLTAHALCLTPSSFVWLSRRMRGALRADSRCLSGALRQVCLARARQPGHRTQGAMNARSK
jgi:hypothetical protein